jgi:LmbE family N-acetylglucosaminyl deacetylase
MTDNPYQKLVAKFAALLSEGRSYPLGGFPPAPRPVIAPDAPRALFFAPHPDDESISGGIALRLLREGAMRVFNVAVTLGSKSERQAERLKELQAACRYIGFDVITTGPRGLEGISAKARVEGSGRWSKSVDIIHKIMAEHQPKVLMFPHGRDWNSTHIGTHLLVMDALAKMPKDFEAVLIETEFWGQNDAPNLMVEISEADLVDLVTATSFHVGEVQRNPYHLSLPAWMMDNVRRGSELVGGQGGKAPDFDFAVLYQARKWIGGAVKPFSTGGRIVSAKESILSALQ